MKNKEGTQLFNNVRFKIGGTYTLGYGIGRVKIESPTAKGKTFKAVRLSDDKSIHFGDASMRTRQDNPEAKKNYCSRASRLNEKGFNPNTLSLIYWDCIPANPASNAMKTNQIMINSTITKGQIVDNGSHWIIQGIPVTVDNAVMNGITYPADENAKGLPTINQRPITGGHPVRDGYPISVNEDMPEWYIGANVAKHYSKDGIHYVDVKASKKMMKNSDNPLGEYFHNKLTSKESFGVSTGLNLQPVQNANGEVMATNQQYDHLAFLHDDERPAGGDSTMVRFNSDGSEIMVINIDDMAKSAREREIEREEEKLDDEEDRLEDEREEKMLKKLMKRFANAVFGDNSDAGYNKQDNVSINTEGDPMREMMLAALAAKGITVNSEISDADLLAKYNEMAANQQKEPTMEELVTAAVNKAMDELKTKEKIEDDKAAKARVEGDKKKEYAEDEDADITKEKMERKKAANALGLPESEVAHMSINSIRKINGQSASITANAAGGYKPEGEDDKTVFGNSAADYFKGIKQ